MDLLHLTICLTPLAMYLLAIGWLNLRRRPTLVSGTRDSLAMAIALSGLMLVGPLELFMPMDAANFFGGLVWLLLITFYVLVATFIVLGQRPRLVVYNVPADVLRPLLAKVAIGMDPDARWAGDSLSMPGMNVELRLETAPLFRNVTLVANNDRQSFNDWKRLEGNLRRELAAVEIGPAWQGLGLLAFGLFLVAFVLLAAASDPNGMAAGLVRMLRI